MLQHAIGEATGGRADVETESSIEADGPVGERGLQLQSAAAYVAKIRAEQADGGVGREGCTGFVVLLLMDENAAGEDECLRALARRHQTPFHKKFVETYFHPDDLRSRLDTDGQSRPQSLDRNCAS